MKQKMNEAEPFPIADLIRRIVKALVDHPEQAEVTAIVGRMSTVIEVRTAPGDMGKLVGRHGRTADAIRTLLVAFGGRYKRRFLLEIIDPREQARSLRR